jgi:hypothetical protein
MTTEGPTEGGWVQEQEKEEEKEQEEQIERLPEENPILERESNRTVINLPNGEIRIIYSMNTDLWTLRIGNPSSRIEDGSETKQNT